jgi:hypothetical protein
MNIILYHTNTPIPPHVTDCIKKIKQYSNIPIYFLTDTDISYDGVNVLNINKYNELNWLNTLDYFSGNDSLSQMWKTSCFRMFYIQKIMQDLNLENVLHFDNDVLLYENPEILIEKISNKYNNFAVTAHSHDEIVFGMSFIKNSNSLNSIVSFIKNELSLPSNILKNKYSGYPSEMRLISASHQCDFLPILPENLTENRFTKNYLHFNSVFDPSSYGQFIGGTFSDKKPGWYGTHQEIGKFIANNQIKIIFENRNPFVIYMGSKIKINNLHIHSKNTGLYL